MSYVECWDDQVLERGYFIPVSAAGRWNRQESAMRLGQIGPVVLSELLGAMAVPKGSRLRPATEEVALRFVQGELRLGPRADYPEEAAGNRERSFP
jgi:hypothetical protein